MTEQEKENKVKELRELMRMAEELNAEIEALKDEFKAEMQAADNYDIIGTDYKITWHEVKTSRIDAKALRADAPEIAEKYTKTTTSRRFLVA